MHLQPAFAGCRAFGGAVAEALFRTGLCLPSGGGVDDAAFDRIVAAIRSAT